MKVALLTEYLTEIGGAEHDLANLAEVFPDAPIYTILYLEHKYSKIEPSRIIESNFGKRLPKFIKGRRRWLLPFFPRAVENIKFPDDIDAVISVSHSFAKGVRLPKGVKHICYCLSPTRYLWDWTHKYVQEQGRSSLLSFMAKWLLHRLRIWDFNVAQKVDIFLANSKTVQKRIWKFYRRKAEVIYPGVSIDRFKKAFSGENRPEIRNWELEVGKYWLVVSQLSKFKNVELVVKAFNKLSLALCIVGSGDQEEFLRDIAKTNIKFLGRVSDEELIFLYQNCYAVIVPCEEDFGLVAIEATASHKPVLALRAGGSLETITEGVTGEFFDRFDDVKALIESVARLRVNYNRYRFDLDFKADIKDFQKVFNQKIIRALNKVA